MRSTGIRVQVALLKRVFRVTPIKKVKWGQRYEGWKGKYLKKSIPRRENKPKVKASLTYWRNIKRIFYLGKSHPLKSMRESQLASRGIDHGGLWESLQELELM